MKTLLPVTLLALFLLGCDKHQEVTNVCLVYDTILVYDTVKEPQPIIQQTTIKTAERRKAMMRQAQIKRNGPVSVNKTSYVKSTGSVTQLNMSTGTGVSQMFFNYKNGNEILWTTVHLDDDIIKEWNAISDGSDAEQIGDTYYVLGVTDSVVRAHRKLADEFYINTINP